MARGGPLAADRPSVVGVCSRCPAPQGLTLYHYIPYSGCENRRWQRGHHMESWMAYSGSGFRPSNVPVEEGKVYEAKIEDIGREGDGLARIQNFVVFVPGTKIGDEVKIRITKVHRRMAFGEVVRE